TMLSSYWVDVLTSVTVYSIVALGLNLLMGRVGLVSLGQIAVLALGSWVAARLAFASGLPFPLVLIGAGLGTMVLGTLVGLPALWHVRARPGRAWAAIRQSEPAALAAGVNITLYKLWAFALASFLTGVAGGLLAAHVGKLYTYQFNTSDSILLLAVVLMGGI